MIGSGRVRCSSVSHLAVFSGDCSRQLRAILFLASVVIVSRGGLVHGQDTTDYYRQNCMNCHTIGGGPLTGPDLKSVTERQDREWLVGFMQNPQAVIASGDPYALKDS